MEISDERLKDYASDSTRCYRARNGNPECDCPLCDQWRMARELREWRKADRWIPVSESLPESVDDYLVEIQFAVGLAKCIDVRTFSDGKFSGVTDGDIVTRWRPLPTPPEVSNG